MRSSCSLIFFVAVVGPCTLTSVDHQGMTSSQILPDDIIAAHSRLQFVGGSDVDFGGQIREPFGRTSAVDRENEERKSAGGRFILDKPLDGDDVIIPPDELRRLEDDEESTLQLLKKRLIEEDVKKKKEREAEGKKAKEKDDVDGMAARKMCNKTICDNDDDDDDYDDEVKRVKVDSTAGEFLQLRIERGSRDSGIGRHLFGPKRCLMARSTCAQIASQHKRRSNSELAKTFAPRRLTFSRTIWDKRDTEEKRKWGDNSMTVWGKRGTEEKRKWGDNSMTVWGKRDEEEKRKWGDNSITAWGKRKSFKPEEKRKWGDNSMTVWGKRQGDENRRWGDSSVTAWSKREQNTQDLKEERKWGDDSISEEGKKRQKYNFDEDSQSLENKQLRLWLQSFPHWMMAPNSMIQPPILHGDIAPTTSGIPTLVSASGSIGKNIGTGLQEMTSNTKSSSPTRSTRSLPEKRKTTPSRLRKRGWGFWGAYASPYEGPKRNWETNTMKVWGKRQDEIEGKRLNELSWKRLWTSDNSLRIWGK